MAYFNTQAYYEAVEIYTSIGWDASLMHALQIQNDEFTISLLTTDLMFRIKRATKLVINTTPQLHFTWIRSSDGTFKRYT
jgi:hypothetical protein